MDSKGGQLVAASMQILHVKKVFLLRKVVCLFVCLFVWFAGLAYQGKDIAFRFIIVYNIQRDFGP
jgi:hypothetical protein